MRVYTTKKWLASDLWKHRITINRMLKDKEVKDVYNQKWKRIWYVLVIDFIKYLVD